MKRTTSFFIMMLAGCASGLYAQVSVTASGAGPGPVAYADFSTAFTAINNGVHTGNIKVAVLANFSESGTPTLNASGSGQASYTAIEIKPSAGVVPVITSTTDNSAAIKLNGADNVTIDGSNTPGGTTRDMTFRNSNTVGSGMASNIWLASAGTNGATNNTIKNCKLLGSSAAGGAAYVGVCVYSSSSVLAGYWNAASATTGANSNNIIQNNLMNGANAAVVFCGGNSLGETGNRIIQNTIGDGASAANLKFTNAGIFLLNQSGFTINQNALTWIGATNANVAPGAISIGSGCTNGTISQNTMTNLRFANTNVLSGGMILNSGTASNINVYNNFISNTASAGSATAASNSFGIAVASGGGYNIAFNSVNMNTNPTTTATGYQAALYIASGTTTLDIRNNLFVHNGSNTTNKFSVYAVAANPAGCVIDYNVYYTTSATLGFAGTAQATLANVQTNLQNNLNHSKNLLPVFVAPANLHLVTGNASNLANIRSAGIAITGIADDYDGMPRPASAAPTMGAHELTPAPCTPPASPSSSDAMLCGSGSTTVSAVGPTGTTLRWYSAATAGVLLAIGTSYTTPVLSATATYYVAAVSFPGCESVRTPVNVIVNPRPAVNLGPDMDTCTDGSTVKIMDPGSPGATATYLWDDGSTAGTRSIMTSGTYFVTVTFPATGCYKADTLHVTFHDNPVVNLGNDPDVCPGFTTTLDAQHPGATYLWNDGSTAQTLQVGTAGNYYVTVTDNHNCKGSDTVTLIVHPGPAVHLGNDTTICNGATLELDAGADGHYYFWSNAATTRKITAVTQGQYWVAATDIYGCIKFDTINIYMLGELPSIDGIGVTNDSIYKFSFQPLNPHHVLSYEWNFGDGSPLSTLQAPTHTYADAGVYTVLLRMTSSCGWVVDSISTQIVGIEQVKIADSDLMIYPNPAVNSITIDNKSALKLAYITIVNVQGQIVYCNRAQSAQRHMMDISALPAGLYQVVLSTDKGNACRKLVVRP